MLKTRAQLASLFLREASQLYVSTIRVGLYLLLNHWLPLNVTLKRIWLRLENISVIQIILIAIGLNHHSSPFFNVMYPIRLFLCLEW